MNILKKLAYLVSLSLIVMLMGCASNSTKTGFKTGGVENIEIRNAYMTMKYDNHQFTRTQYGTDIIIIYFTFTNHTDEYLCMNNSAHFKAYQGGMQLDGLQLDTESGNNGWREISKGKTLSCAIAFKVSGTSAVQLRVSPIIDGTFDGSQYQEQILSFGNS